jgi:hypothetical protein
MMVFPTSMRPHALGDTRQGRPHTFTCDICSAKGQGRHFPPRAKEKKDWAVLPEEWTEVEDRRPTTKKPFLIVCQTGDCQYRAEQYHTGG